jgi:hypothetical protein
MEWFLWLAVFRFGRYLPVFWIKTEIVCYSTPIFKTMERAMNTMEEAYNILGLAVPQMIETRGAAVIASTAPLQLSELTGYVGSVDTLVAIKFS